MGNIIKYDLKGGYKKFSIVFIITMILSSIIIFRMNENNLGLSTVGMVIVYFGSLLTILIYCANDFEKDLYEERAYLTFTLPVKGREILGGKLIVYIIWTVVNSIILSVFVLIFMQRVSQIMGLGKVTAGNTIYWPAVIVSELMSIFFIASFMLLVYLCTILPRVTNLNAKLSKFMSIVVFLGMLVGIGYLESKIGEIFPKEIFISPKGVTGFEISGGSNLSMDAIVQLELMRMPLGMSSVNIAKLIYDIVLFIIFFVFGSYLLDNKIDLK